MSFHQISYLTFPYAFLLFTDIILTVWLQYMTSFDGHYTPSFTAVLVHVFNCFNMALFLHTFSTTHFIKCQ